MSTFVLVHGAWQGGWVWQRVAGRLRAEGHLVLSPGLTGLGERSHLLDAGQGLSTYITDVQNVLVYEDLHDIVLVGHSFGGMVITGVADREPGRISRLVYLDAMVPVNGESAWDMLPEFRPVYYEGPASGDGWSVPAPPAALFNVNEADRDRVDALSSACPISVFIERIKLTGDYLSVPRRDYVLATGWGPSPLTRTYDRLAEDPTWATAVIDAGHNVMLDQPEFVADYLLERIPRKSHILSTAGVEQS